jgi:hypothetical protein
MFAIAALAGWLVTAPVENLPTAFWQITVTSREPGLPDGRSKDRAVVLIHGLVPHILRAEKTGQPNPTVWQKPGSELVRKLSGEFDVYGFSYAQTLPVDMICHSCGLRNGVRQLKEKGYSEIVLVGHSAGAVVARQFVEAYPRAGVTRVIAVAGPHAGSPWARLPRLGLPDIQEPFIKSLSPSSRMRHCEAGRPVDEDIEFCCLVCKLPRRSSDRIVPADSQWPPELRRQGVPAVCVPLDHFDVVRTGPGAEVIAGLARIKSTRWTPEQVEQFERHLDRK